MSWLMVGGLHVECGDCGRVRVIPRRGGADYLQVGDRHVMEQMAVRAERGEQDANLFYLNALCPDCVAGHLDTPQQALYRIRQDILTRRDEWLNTFRSLCQARFEKETLAALDSMDSLSWLRRYFPEAMKRLAEDRQCRQADYFASRRKSLRKLVVSEINNTDVLMSAELKDWMKGSLKDLNLLREETDRLEAEVIKRVAVPDETWVLLDEVDVSRGGLCLNPYIAYEQSIFVGEEGADALLYFAFRVEPEWLVSGCRAALEHPYKNAWEFVMNPTFMEGVSERVRGLVNGLSWPLPEIGEG